MISLLIAIAMAGADPPPAAQTPGAAPQPAAEQTEEGLTFGIIEGKDQPKPKKVCFNDPVSGSRIPTKRCMDRDEFYRRQAEARQYTEQIQRDARAPPSN